MPTASLKIFISSPRLDLQPERQAVETVLHRLRETEFAGMEYFGSRQETPLLASLDEVNRSHVYVGIFDGRYGSGVTEEEYRRARERDLPCLIYFKEDSIIQAEMRETDTAQLACLDALKEELRRAHTVSTFKSPEDLAARVEADLHNWLFDEYLTPLLEEAARGEAPRTEAQDLLDAIMDFGKLDQRLQSQLKRAGYNIAISGKGNIAGNKNVAIGGHVGGSFVAGDQVTTHNYNTASPLIHALHQLPPPPRDFTGRAAELAELMGEVERGGANISGLQGLGGVGKTALALKLAERLTARYPDAQFYLDLKGASKSPLAAADAMAHVIRAYHPEAKLPEGEAELGGLYRSLLHSQRALLLMDNAASREQVEPLIPPESCVMLVTSRQRFTLPGLFTKNLDALPAEDARKLLLRIAPRIGEQADTLAKLCGYLPLALRLAASAMVVRVDLRVEDYVRRLADARQRLKLLGEIEASLSLSYELLDALMQKSWCLLSVFPGTFDALAAAAVWDMSEDAARDTLSDLALYSMVEWNITTARYSLHDLARLFAGQHLSDDERSAGQTRHAEHFLNVLREADKLYLQGGEAIKRGLALFDLELTNIQFGQSWAANGSSENDISAKLCSAYLDAGAYLLSLRQHPRERIEWLKCALAAAIHLKDRSAEGRHLGNLGLAYADLGETRRAIEFYEQHLNIAREISDRHGEGNALGNLGIAYKNLGETRRAIEFYEQALTIFREIGDRPGEGADLGNLGNAYADLGETRRAIEFYEQALTIDREIGDRRGEGTDLGNLGLAYADLGETRRAIEFYEQALTIDREIGDRRGEGADLGNLGNAYAGLGETRRAIEFYEQHLNIAREISDRHGEANALCNSGMAYAVLGETQRAIEFLEQALTIYREMGNRRGEGNALWNTSLVLDKIGERAQAIAHAEDALKIMEEIEDPNAAMVLEALAEWRGEGAEEGD